MWQSYAILSATTQWIFTFHWGPTVPTSSQRMNGNRIHQTSTHLTVMCGVLCFRHLLFAQTSLEAQDYSGAIKCTAADLGWLAADNDQQSYKRLLQTCWTHTSRLVVDILNIRYELYTGTEVFWLNTVCCFRNGNELCVYHQNSKRLC